MHGACFRFAHFTLYAIIPAMTVLKDYIEASFLARATEKELLTRLDLITLKPKNMVDIGCGPGLTINALRKKYPDAKIYGIDHCKEMLAHAETLTEAHWLCEDAGSLSLADKSIDCVFSNLLLYPDLPKLFTEWYRILRPEGVLMFTCFGPSTLNELTHQQNFTDMHLIGDLLLKLGFQDPVLDVETYQVVYQDREKMVRELRVMQLITDDFVLPEMVEILPLTFEIVYGHAWGGEIADETGVVKIPLSSITGLRV
ncbi:MAG TPA: methyltransferase domain-containing protein [Gammaproteobacteria bacterium]|jgi:malonyl-CoA O-methyltransferase|nr:methyltransferase domain-containing protein [Gammaproteobacteria bacterium]